MLSQKVAEALTARGVHTRSGRIWDKGAVLQTLQQSAAEGVVRWGVPHRGKLQPPEKWLTLHDEPIIDAKTYALVKELCEQRRPTTLPERASAKPRVLTELVRFGLCESSYQLETSGKSRDGSTYSYCYYNCRKTLRAREEGVGALPRSGVHARGPVADVVCSPPREPKSRCRRE